MVKLNDTAITMFTVELLPLQAIGDSFKVSRVAVRNYLNRRGIDTSKRKYPVKCARCGRQVMRNKAWIRRVRHPYCGHKCYYKALPNPKANISRWGQMQARETVAQFFGLRPEHVVHHEDGNDLNNNPANLTVFDGHASHLWWHRGYKDKSIILWRGLNTN